MYDTVKLHKGNNWRYTWNDLRRGYDWSVVEETIPGYTVNVSQEGITFLITNTYVPDSPEPDGGSDPPGDGVSVEHEGEGWLGVLGDMEEDFQMQILPQTGQLWWPALSGFSSGWVIIFCAVAASAWAAVRYPVGEEDA